MYPVNVDQVADVTQRINLLVPSPLAVEVRPDSELDRLLLDLSPDVSWGDRKIAAQKLGNLHNTDSLPGLVAALPIDPFWMVRCEIITALVKIGDARAVPALQEAAENDRYQAVRSYAAKAVIKLS